METLCRITCFFCFLWCLAIVVRTRGDTMLTSRQQKLEQLLRSLRDYKKPQEDFSNLGSKIQLTSISSTPEMDHFTTETPTEINNTSTNSEHPEPFPDGSYQDFYRVFYGTDEGIRHLKKHYGPNGLQQARAKYGGVRRELEDLKRANEHFLRIRTRARCKVPSARLVRVKDYYPDPSREYLPRCTLLHRCGDTSGCCDNDAFHCVPSALQEVTLHFYTLTVGKYGLGSQAHNNIERLLFVNHTACECQPINDLPRMEKDGLPHPLDGTAPDEQKAPAKSHHHRIQKCRECPMPFTSRTYRDGRCGCDCFDRQKPCLKIKRGRQALPEVERRCVEANYCHIPDCEYGVFDATSGYCPRRHDEVQRSDHRLPKHRKWAFLQRD